MNMRRSLVLLATCSLALPLLAHDFWMQPSSFTPAKGALLSVALEVGDFAVGERVPRNNERILDFSAHGPGVDKPIVGRDGSDPAGYVRVESDGLYVLGYRSKHASVELEGAKFEGYLREKGLDAVSELRAQRGEQEKAARERYSRCCKALVQVGQGDGTGFDRMLGYPLELLPERNPFDLKLVDKGDGASALEPLSLRLFYAGKPLANALIGALDLDLPKPAPGEPHQTPLTVRTDAEGRATIELPHAGRWLFAAVHMIPCADTAESDWESFWSSLAIEIPRAPAKDSGTK